jgi:hypothetical protein
MSQRTTKTVPMTSASGAVLPLQPSGSAFNEVGWLTATAMQSGGAASEFWVLPVTVAAGGTVPSAPSGAPSPAPGAVDVNYIHLKSGTNSAVVELGQKYAPGYSAANAQALGLPVATHLLIWCVAAGDLVVVGQ